MNRKKVERIKKAMSEIQDALSNIKQILSSEDTEVDDSEAYNKGLEDAWKLAQKICTNYNIRHNVFEYSYALDILDNFTPQEALAKLEAYEKEQEEIKAGDYCVDEDGLKWLVTYVNKGELPNDIDYHCIDNKGYTSPVLYHKGELKKTGKHIDISSVLEQIGGGE